MTKLRTSSTHSQSQVAVINRVAKVTQTVNRACSGRGPPRGVSEWVVVVEGTPLKRRSVDGRMAVKVGLEPCRVAVSCGRHDVRFCADGSSEFRNARQVAERTEGIIAAFVIKSPLAGDLVGITAIIVSHDWRIINGDCIVATVLLSAAVRADD